MGSMTLVAKLDNNRAMSTSGACHRLEHSHADLTRGGMTAMAGLLHARLPTPAVALTQGLRASSMAVKCFAFHRRDLAVQESAVLLHCVTSMTLAALPVASGTCLPLTIYTRRSTFAQHPEPPSYCIVFIPSSFSQTILPAPILPRGVLVRAVERDRNRTRDTSPGPGRQLEAARQHLQGGSQPLRPPR